MSIKKKSRVMALMLTAAMIVAMLPMNVMEVKAGSDICTCGHSYSEHASGMTCMITGCSCTGFSPSSSSSSTPSTPTTPSSSSNTSVTEEIVEENKMSAEEERLAREEAEKQARLEEYRKNSTVSTGGNVLKSTIDGSYTAVSVNGIAVTTPVDQAEKNCGLSEGEKLSVTTWDITSKNSPEATKSLQDAASSVKGEVGPTFQININKMSDGQLVSLEGTKGSVSVTVGIPDNFYKEGSVYSVAEIGPNGKSIIIWDTDNNSRTVSFPAGTGNKAYVLIRMEKNNTAKCPPHQDRNYDGNCDICGINLNLQFCPPHLDIDGDGKCEYCGVICGDAHTHQDRDGDGKCDICGLGLKGSELCPPHLDIDGDGKCEYCGVICGDPKNNKNNPNDDEDKNKPKDDDDDKDKNKPKDNDKDKDKPKDEDKNKSKEKNDNKSSVSRTWHHGHTHIDDNSDGLCDTCGNMINKTNATVIADNGEIVSTIPGSFNAQSVAGAAFTTPATQAAQELGLSAGESLNVSTWDVTSKNSPLAFESLENAAALAGGELGPAIQVNINKTSGGKQIPLSESNGHLGMTVGIPDSFYKNGGIYAVVHVIEGGSAEILKDTDTDPNTVSFNADAGNGAYALVRLK